MINDEKVVKFHGTKVANVTILYAIKSRSKPDKEILGEFDAAKNPEICETLNIQIVSDYVTITFYEKESSNSIMRRELIPTHTIQRIWVEDLLLPGPSRRQEDNINAGQVTEELQKEERELQQISVDPEQILEEQERTHIRSSQG
jgi:hypothetical protein